MSKSFDQDRAERAISELLAALGEDLERDGLRDTPKRVARALKENFQGLYQDPKDVLTTTFDLGHEELIIVKDIEVYSHCEHHLAPFFGVAHIGYIPGESGKVTGLSKLARLVDLYARRPQVQERLTTQIADSMVEILQPGGVIVIIDCEHLCMSMRGVRKSQANSMQTGIAETLTSSGLIDLIVGHHAHVVQPIEQVNGVWVMYGLGNVLSNLPTDERWPANSQDAVIATIKLTKRPSGKISFNRPQVMPTWVDKRNGWVIRDVLTMLSDPKTDYGTARELELSLGRTTRVLGDFIAR